MDCKNNFFSVTWIEKCSVPESSKKVWNFGPYPLEVKHSPWKWMVWKMSFLLGRPIFRGYVKLPGGLKYQKRTDLFGAEIWHPNGGSPPEWAGKWQSPNHVDLLNWKGEDPQTCWNVKVNTIKLVSGFKFVIFFLENYQMSPENQWLEDVFPIDIVPF